MNNKICRNCQHWRQHPKCDDAGYCNSWMVFVSIGAEEANTNKYIDLDEEMNLTLFFKSTFGCTFWKEKK